MNFSIRLFCLALLLSAPLAHAQEHPKILPLAAPSSGKGMTGSPDLPLAAPSSGKGMTGSSEILPLATPQSGLAPLAHAWERPEMAAYGTTYNGPEQLEVYVAHTKADDHAVVKIRGINHPLDGRVFWVKVVYSKSSQREGFPNRILYLDESVKEEHLRAVLLIEDSSGMLYLPNYRGQARAEIPVRYNREFSRGVRPEHILMDYERQIGKIQ